VGVEYGVYDFVVFGPIPRPVNLSSALDGVAFELLEVLIEVSEGVFFDF
jgi:hypothetical protein